MKSRRTTQKPFVIGLVGGVASGKSHLTRLFESKGVAVIDADQLGHRVLQQPLVARRIGQVFGQGVLDQSGNVNRVELGKLVFGTHANSAQLRRQLEEIVHPLIHAEAVQRLAEFKSSPSPPLAVVIDAPLLLEAKWEPMCDAIIFVEASATTRRERAMQRGWTEQQWVDRESAQLALDEKRQRATHIVSSETATTELEHFCDQFLAQITRYFAD